VSTFLTRKHSAISTPRLFRIVEVTSNESLFG
jgi:hypothetical protein